MKQSSLEKSIRRVYGNPEGEAFLRKHSEFLRPDSMKYLRDTFHNYGKSGIIQLVKQQDSSLSDSEADDISDKIIQEIFGRSGGGVSTGEFPEEVNSGKLRLADLLSRERQKTGGTENFVNRNSPGQHQPLLSATPNEAGYGRQARTIRNVENIYRPGEFSPSAYDSGYTSRVRNPGSQVNSSRAFIPRTGTTEGIDPNYSLGNRSRGSSPDDARAMSYGEYADLNTRRATTEPGIQSTTYKRRRALSVLKEVERRNMEAGSGTPMYTLESPQQARMEGETDDEAEFEGNPNAKIPAVPGRSGSSGIIRVGTRMEEDESDDEQDEAFTDDLGRTVNAEELNERARRLEAEAVWADQESGEDEASGNWRGRDAKRLAAMDLRRRAMQIRSPLNKAVPY